jgi:hypothetical protein
MPFRQMQFMKIFKNYIRKANIFNQDRRKRKAINDLLKKYKYVLEVDHIMESWITKRILEGQQGRRNELLEKQQAIKEQELFIEYLEKL